MKNRNTLTMTAVALSTALISPANGNQEQSCSEFVNPKEDITISSLAQTIIDCSRRLQGTSDGGPDVSFHTADGGFFYASTLSVDVSGDEIKLGNEFTSVHVGMIEPHSVNAQLSGSSLAVSKFRDKPMVTAQWDRNNMHVKVDDEITVTPAGVLDVPKPYDPEAVDCARTIILEDFQRLLRVASSTAATPSVGALSLSGNCTGV